MIRLFEKQAAILAASVRGTLVQNALTLYFLQALTYVFPLLTVPYLVRTLQPAGWGAVAFAQSFAQILTLFIEYGFQLSATRELAQHRDSLETRGRILWEVVGAKCVLLILIAVLVFGIRSWLPVLASESHLLWAAVLWAAGQGFSMAWYFQGTERLRPLLIAEIAARTAGTAGVFLLVSTPEDGWKVLAVDGCASLIASAISFAWVSSLNPLILPNWRSVILRLRSGWNVFCYRAGLALYSVGNPVLLGWLAPIATVGFFAAADKLARAFLALVYPLTQTLYPRIAFLVKRDRKEASRMARFGLVFSAGVGISIGLFLFAAAPLLISVVLSPKFAGTIPALRILALLCPLIAVNTVLSFHWLLPRHLDRELTIVTFLAGLLNICLAVAFAPRQGASGMAWAVVCTELFVSTGLSLVLFVSRNRAR